MSVHAASVSRGAVNLPQTAGGSRKVSEGSGGGQGAGKTGNLDLSQLAVEEDKLLTPEEQKSKNKTNRETLNIALMNGGCSRDFTLARAEAYAESESVGQEFDGLVLDELRELHSKTGVQEGTDTDPTDPKNGTEDSDVPPTPGTPGTPGCGCDKTSTASDPGGYLYGKDGKPSPDEVKQWAVGDCYFLASAMALAGSDPKAIQKLIKANDDGSYTVTLYETEEDSDKPLLDENGKPKTVEITVKKEDVDRATALGGAKPGAGGAHWAQVLETAYAMYISPHSLSRGLQGIENGLTQQAFTMLTGKPGTVMPFKGSKPEDIVAALNDAKKSGAPLTLHAFPEDGDVVNGQDGYDKDQDGLVDGHAYEVVSTETDSAGEVWVTLRNPGGRDAPVDANGKPILVDGQKPDQNPDDGVVRVKLSDIMKNEANELVVGSLPDGLQPTGTDPDSGSSDGGDNGGATSRASSGVPGRQHTLSSESVAWGSLIPARIAELYRLHQAA